VTLPAGTQLAETLYRAAQPLLAREVSADRQRRFRLIGIGAAELAEPGGVPAQTDLFAPAATASADDPKLAAVEKAMDAVRGKFGSTAIRKGRGLGIGKGARRGRDLPRSTR
jgi:DNA polymerase-4